eukprot:4893242-Karenia_brevis.AAC.1
MGSWQSCIEGKTRAILDDREDAFNTAGDGQAEGWILRFLRIERRRARSPLFHLSPMAELATTRGPWCSAHETLCFTSH